MSIINKHQKTILSQQGFTLVEFMISMALSLAAILVVTSIYITSFQIDSKTIKFSRLNDEVTSIMALLSEDIKRAGYFKNAENVIKDLTNRPSGNTSACDPDPVNCAPEEFRTILVSDATAGVNDNSCILFSYDFNDNGIHDPSDEDFGYRFKDNQLQTRKAASDCDDGTWESLTDPDFVNISAIEISPAVPAAPDVPAVPAVYGDVFKCKVSDDGDATDYEIDTVAGVTTDIETPCTVGYLPYKVPVGTELPPTAPITVEISFTATLVDDPSISITTSEKVLVRNVSYD